MLNLQKVRTKPLCAFMNHKLDPCVIFFLASVRSTIIADFFFLGVFLGTETSRTADDYLSRFYEKNTIAVVKLLKLTLLLFRRKKL